MEPLSEILLVAVLAYFVYWMVTLKKAIDNTPAYPETPKTKRIKIKIEEIPEIPDAPEALEDPTEEPPRPKRFYFSKIDTTFKYKNLSTIDLTRYQIYANDDLERQAHEDNSLISTLRKTRTHTFLERDLTHIKDNFSNGEFIASNNLNAIADFLNVRFMVYTLQATNTTMCRNKIYGSAGPIVSIARHEGHLFPYENTTYTKADVLAIFNIKSRATKRLTSLRLVQYLLDKGLLSQ